MTKQKPTPKKKSAAKKAPAKKAVAKKTASEKKTVAKKPVAKKPVEKKAKTSVTPSTKSDLKVKVTTGDMNEINSSLEKVLTEFVSAPEVHQIKNVVNVIRANDVQSVNVRKRMLKWFRRK
jgi:hypothetical protein